MSGSIRDEFIEYYIIQYSCSSKYLFLEMRTAPPAHEMVRAVFEWCAHVVDAQKKVSCRRTPRIYFDTFIHSILYERHIGVNLLKILVFGSVVKYRTMILCQ